MQSGFLPLLTQAPKKLLPWLEHQSGPLTIKLREQTGDAQLKLLQQSWEKPSYWDKQVLSLANTEILKREIVMYSGGKACWYAKTLIPRSCYDADELFFKNLDSGALTPLVFNEPKVVREELFYYGINAQCLEFYWLSGLNQSKIAPLWLRFSNFQFLKRENFYLIEVFLPDFIEVIS